MTISRIKHYVQAAALLSLVGCSRNLRQDNHQGDIPLSSRIALGELANGLSYYVLNNRDPEERCYVRLNVAIGSFVEEDNELGMAHFVEHLAFDDRTISGSESLADWFQKHGMAVGPDANAETYPEHTTYKIDLPTCDHASMQAALGILRSFADGLTFSEESIAKEKNIIDAEEREYNDSQTKLTKKLMNSLYSDTFYVSRPVLGYSATRALFTPAMLKSFHDKWYTPDSMSVVIVGDFGDLKPQKLIASTFDSMPQGRKPKKPNSPNPSHDTPFFAVHEDNLAHVETIFSIQAKTLTKPSHKIEHLKQKIAFDLALAMVQENITTTYQQTANQIREPAVEGSFVNDGVYELVLSVASMESDLEAQFLDAYGVLANGAHNGFDENAFNAAKAVFRDTLEQAVVTEHTLNSDAWTDRIINHIYRSERAVDAAMYLMTIEPILANITAKDSQDALKKALGSGHHYLYALGAITEGPTTKKRLANLLKEAKRLKPDPVVATPSMPFLYHNDACVAEALAREPLPALGASKVRLNNGIEIILKPTKFKTDEIRIEILTNEGDGGMSKEDLARGNLAKLTLFEGGLGRHEPSSITQLIKDKYFTMSLSVLTDRLQASIATRNRDLPFALELAKAYIVDPAYRDAVVKRVKGQIALVYQEAENKVWTPLENSFLRQLTNNDYRVGVIPFAEIASITRDDLVAWHKRYIVDQNLRFVVVGDIKEDEVLQAIYCTFNDFPKQDKHNTKIAKLSFKSGIHEIYHVTSKDEAALANIRYPLNYTGTPYPDHRLQIVKSVLNEVLREKLREKKQTSYSPTVTIAENKVNSIQNWLDIAFLVETVKAEQAVKDSKLIVDKLAQKGIDNDKLTKAKEPYIAQAKQAILDNNYWASVLANNLDDIASLSWLTRVAEDVAAITIQDINQLLRKYFRVQSASSAIVFPNKQK